MRTDKPDKDYAKVILYGSNEPVFIPLDVEYDPVFG